MSTSRELIQQLLSTCQRCRRLRRKCDTLLPDCRLCRKAGVECYHFDHALQQSLPRAYVHSLLARLEHLEAVKRTIDGSSDQQDVPRPVLPNTPTSDHPFPHPPPSQPSQVDNRERVPQSVQYDPYLKRDQTDTFDKHFIIPSAAGRSRFFGASSVFTISVELFRHAITTGLLPEGSLDLPISRYNDKEECADTLAIRFNHQAQAESVRELCRFYFVTSNVLYGFVDEHLAANDVEVYLDLRGNPLLNPQDLRGVEAHQYFRVSMMCAISCSTQARHRHRRLVEGMAYYKNALDCVEEVTSEVTPASLQALLLLSIFCLFQPRKGDIWKLLDYACRLSVELGYHTEQQVEVETEAQKRLRRSTFWGLYAIERIVGQLFGRGSDLPEPIITTEYPRSLSAIDSMDQASVQPISIAHHYRLVYLRSEIFRDLYMPADPPQFEFDWYRDRFSTLHLWRQEHLVSDDDLAGPGTISCDVGYNSTICFLFQPLLLVAIRTTTMNRNDSSTDFKAVPQDNYWSACALIRTYEKVIRAPEKSILGAYPMTFLSAHYIYLAGITLMAHALLAIDSRVPILKPMLQLGETPEIGSLDLTNFYEISNSCLILLSFCAERWTGMEGMLYSFKKLSDKIIPALLRRQP
ncbi:uncharacterized protein BDZ99DRAFT_546055 [Mytilinidion resinicola]|uniref:Zn(2)-C6 fungal-type domain-containing protein n=1 Tax=Mytilinidion resinicola TaxID=574789 RepID=A0A6A6Y5Z3_9PEZI|nr:uncharacterized protein BDZ99DRAFT_546055 [Mytilinidion resinicola]KAF2804090.1 hypothetical protein BDZ99DRAFT_546055 [Mytilinidion resinicola]